MQNPTDREHRDSARRFLTGQCGCTTCRRHAVELYPLQFAQWCEATGEPVPVEVLDRVAAKAEQDRIRAATWRPDWAVVGMDLGKRTDHSAVSVLVPTPPDHATAARYVMTTWGRLPKHMSYLDQRDRAEQVINGLRGYCGPRARIKFLVDGTGVGDAVVELFRDRITGSVDLIDVKITAGMSINYVSSRQWNISKTQLIAPLQKMLFDGSIEVGAIGDNASTVRNELVSYTVRPSAVEGAADRMDNGKDSDHDDLVISGSLAAFAAARAARNGVTLVSPRSAMLRRMERARPAYQNVYRR